MQDGVMIYHIVMKAEEKPIQVKTWNEIDSKILITKMDSL